MQCLVKCMGCKQMLPYDSGNPTACSCGSRYALYKGHPCCIAPDRLPVLHTHDVDGVKIEPSGITTKEAAERGVRLYDE